MQVPSIDGPGAAVVTYSRQYRRCGKPGCSVCRPGAPGHGPYWYAYWRESGRLRSRYLGKENPSGATRDLTTTPGIVVLASGPAAPGVAAGTGLRARTLGGLAVWRDDEPIVPALWARHKARDLFTCLLSAPEHRLHRERILDLLWPECPLGAGAGRVRATVHALRKALDGPVVACAPAGDAGNAEARRDSYLRSDGATLVLTPAPGREPEADWLDAAAFMRAAAAALHGRDAGACRAALALYGGEYLPGDTYQEWVLTRREELRHRYLDLVLHLAWLDAARGETGEAEEGLRAVLAADRCHEAAAQQLMGLLASDGRRGEALRVYQALDLALRDEFDLRPNPETAALRARLLAQESGPVAARVEPRVPAPARLTNLPAPLSAFIGRDRDRVAVRDLIAANRLVTLTGAGGCGKTRLAIQVGEDLAPAYPDGVWLVELAARTDPSLVPQIVARALGLREDSPRGADSADAADAAAPDALVDFLRPRRLLLVLDNCEHLVDACAALAAALLAACPHLRILGTSREALRVDGEAVWPVPSLAVPPRAGATPAHPDDLARYDAVQLFLQRARLVRPDVALTRQNAPAVVEICRRLDGIPLAIELAAARLGVLTVEALSDRLDDCFRMLVGGSRTALPRHQTLRAALDWGYALLDAPERALLRRLAVFAGGWTLDAAAAVCADIQPDDEVTERAVLDLLARLAHKSLLVVASEGGEARYSLLEMVRQYGCERLEAAGETRTLRERRLDYYLTLAEGAGVGRAGADPGRLEAERDNLHAALQSAWESEDLARALRLCLALCRYWELRGYLGEGRRWLGLLCDAGDAVPADGRARALNAAGNLAYRQGDYKEAMRLLEEGVALRRASGDRTGLAMSLNNLGLVAHEQGAYARAQALFDESLALKQEAGDARGVAHSLTNLGRVAHRQGDLARAAELHARGLALLREVDDRHSLARSLHNLAEVVHQQGDEGRAGALLEESAALKRELGDRQGLAASLHLLGTITARRGEHRRAEALLTESLEISRALDDRQGIAATSQALAALV